MVSQGVSMLWSSFTAPKKVRSLSLFLSTRPEFQRDADSCSLIYLQSAERLNMRMSELVENVSRKPIPPWTKTLLVEVMVNDEEGEDVEVSRPCFHPILFFFYH